MEHGFLGQHTVELGRQTVRIHGLVNGSQELLGTGFFVTPQSVLTCNHVAIDPKTQVVYQNLSIQIGTTSVPCRITKQDPNADVALLFIEPQATSDFDLGSVVSLKFDGSIGIFDRVLVYGFTTTYQGGVGAIAEFEYSALEDPTRPDYIYLKFKGGQFTRGMSGSPIINLSTGRICGMAKRTRNNDSDLGGYAIPLATIARIVPELGLVRVARDEFSKMQRRHERIDRLVKDMGKDREDWIGYLVYVASPLDSATSRRRFDIIVDEADRSDTLAIHASEYPGYNATPLATQKRLIERSNIAVFDLTDEHPDVLFQFGYHEQFEVHEWAPEGALLLRHTSSTRQFTIMSFRVDEFSDEEGLRAIFQGALKRIGRRPRKQKRARPV